MKRGFISAAMLMLLQRELTAAGAEWISAPKPKFSSAALESGSEGSVKLQVTLTQDGHVERTTVIKSSGDSRLDAAAQKAVAKWRMNPASVTAADLSQGRAELIEFKQEAHAASRYPDRNAWFTNPNSVDFWMFAPFPAYPLRVRERYHTGIVLLQGTIGSDGRATNVQVVRSSGHSDLDQLAVAAVRLWRAHKQYAGKKFKIPIDFDIGGKHYKT